MELSYSYKVRQLGNESLLCVKLQLIEEITVSLGCVSDRGMEGQAFIQDSVKPIDP